MQLTITRLVVRDALHGIRLVERNRNVILAECHVYHNRGIGVFFDRLNLHQVNIANCHISYNAGGGIVVRQSEIRNLQIACCDIEANMGEEDDPPSANILFDTTVGTIREGAIIGCTIQHSPIPRGSANIRFIGTSRQRPHKVGNLAISDNLMSDVDMNIHMVHARGVTITGNSIHRAFSSNIFLEDCSNIVLASNLFDRNPDYGFDSPSALVFRDCQDCTLNGLHVNGVLDSPAGIFLEDCRRFNITNCTILDCDNCGLLLKNVLHSRVSDCLIRDDRPEATSVPLTVIGGNGNMIVHNLFDRRPRLGESSQGASGNVVGGKPPVEKQP
jgi:parallel beta-helix repeat protein